jgi:nicotinamidase-related amidase
MEGIEITRMLKPMQLNCCRDGENWGFPFFTSAIDSDSPLHASQPGFAFKAEVLPLEGEPIITKDVNSAFIGTDLKERLDQAGIQDLVIAGLTTNHCVSTTTRMAGNLGYQTYLISDATAAFDSVGIHGEHYPADLIHLTTLASLKDEFAEIKETTELLAML